MTAQIELKTDQELRRYSRGTGTLNDPYTTPKNQEIEKLKTIIEAASISIERLMVDREQIYFDFGEGQFYVTHATLDSRPVLVTLPVNPDQKMSPKINSIVASVYTSEAMVWFLGL